MLQPDMVAHNVAQIEPQIPIAIVSPKVSTINLKESPHVIKSQVQVASLSISKCGRYQVERIKPHVKQDIGLLAADKVMKLGVATEDGQIATLLPITSIDKKLPSLLIMHRQMQNMRIEQPESQPTESASTPKPESLQNFDSTADTEYVQQKCRDFMLHTFALAKDPQVRSFVLVLTQNLINGIVSIRQYCESIKRLLTTELHPSAEGILEVHLPALRRSLFLKTIVMEGINPPPYEIAFQIVTMAPLLEYPPVATVAPLQPLPLDDIPFDKKLTLAIIAGPLAESLKFCEMIDADPQPDDLHLFSPYVGYVHVRNAPKQDTTDTFQIGDTTIKLVKVPRDDINEQWPTYNPENADSHV